MTKNMNIPQAGKEGYLIKVTPENYLKLLELARMREIEDEYINYDPNWSPQLLVVGTRTRPSVFTHTTLITVEELKLLLFIHSLEK